MFLDVLDILNFPLRPPFLVHDLHLCHRERVPVTQPPIHVMGRKQWGEGSNTQE